MSLLISLLKRYWRTRQLVERFCQKWYGLPFPLSHYYSPVPDLHRLKAHPERWLRELPFADVAIQAAPQHAFLEQLESWNGERGCLPSFEQVTAEQFGCGYGQIEADLLYHCIRYFKPKSFVEIGSGVSTRFALQAIEANRAEDSSGQVVCVEPHPWPKLKELARDGKIQLLPIELQDVDLSVFTNLAKDDILFIDSTHAAKIDGDLYSLYLEILPLLKPGVVVHIHDITFPFLTPPPTHPLFDNFLLWNEAALVKAFLSFNHQFEVLICQSWLHFKAPQILRGFNPAYDPALHFPASLWLRRV